MAKTSLVFVHYMWQALQKWIKAANRRMIRNCADVRKGLNKISPFSLRFYWQESCSQMCHTRALIRSSVAERKRGKKSCLKRRKICDRLTSSRIIRPNQSPGSGWEREVRAGSSSVQDYRNAVAAWKDPSLWRSTTEKKHESSDKRNLKARTGEYKNWNIKELEV